MEETDEMTKPTSVHSREIVLNILLEVLEEGQYSSIVLRNTLRNYQYLEKQERAFLSRLTEGTVERVIELDYILNQFSKVKVKKMKPVIRNILRMGVYQIKYMEQVPDSAACNEAVKLAQKKGFHNLKGFVNGILRNVSRKKEDIMYPKENENPIASLSICYSVPEWLVKMWLEDYDLDIVKAMLKASLQEKATTIRCNTKQTTLEQLKEMLKKADITVKEGTYLDCALKIENYNYINQIPGFLEGKFSVQDESSMLVALAAGVKENDYVIDVCAAPGGKSLHLAEKLNGTGLVSARDLTDKKVNLILENKNRLQLSNIEPKRQDALELEEDSIKKADIVIADLPCSGLGVIGKKNDIKYKVTQEGLQALAKLQRDILEVVSQYVKEDGVLIYSTCTVNKRENIENVNWFLQNHPFMLESLDSFLPEKLHNEETKQGHLQCIPGIHDTDGFFLARLRRKCHCI